MTAWQAKPAPASATHSASAWHFFVQYGREPCVERQKPSEQLSSSTSCTRLFVPTSCGTLVFTLFLSASHSPPISGSHPTANATADNAKTLKTIARIHTILDQVTRS